jgi:hypothetical protein
MPTLAKPDAAGLLVLRADTAEVHGSTAKYESDKQAIGFWTNPADRVEWQMNYPRATRGEIVLSLACEPASAGSEFELRLGDRAYAGTVPATKGWSDFVDVYLRPVAIPSGPTKVTVAIKKMPGMAAMNLRSITVRAVPD